MGENGGPKETCTNDDIMDYARLWTGFEYGAGRNNLGSYDPYTNFVDPFEPEISVARSIAESEARQRLPG